MTERRLEGAAERSTQDQVWEEIHRDWKESYPNVPEENHDVVGNFLNNFFMKLYAATNTEKALQEHHWSKEHSDTSPLQRLSARPDPHWTADARTTYLDWGYSEKWLTKTGADHLADVVAAIKAAGINEDELKTYVENYQRHSSKEETERLLLPVYIKLREMGYSHEDLRISS